MDSVIEISQRLFRRRSVIRNNYGRGKSLFWKTRLALKSGDVEYVNLVLKDSPRPVKDALLLINTYPTLQAMLDRIAELERELALSNENKDEALAVLRALEFKILDGKQRFRSPVAQEIRANIRFAFREMGTWSFVGCRVDKWRAKFLRPDSNIVF